MTPRILHVLDHSIPLHSGYAFRTLAILREQRARGWETLQLTSPKQGEAQALEETVDGFLFHRTRAPREVVRSSRPVALLRQMAATQRRIAELVYRHRPDVIHAHSPILNAFPALWAGRRTGVPVVYEVRALWEDAATDHGTTTDRSMRYRLSRLLETHAVRHADHVTTICEGLRNELRARGVADDRITVIPNAVDIAGFRVGASADPALAAQLGLQGRTVLGFAGSFYAYEGLDLLLDAFARLAPARPDVAVLLLGGGPQEQALRERAASLGVAGRVIFAGRVPHQDVNRYYNLIDLLVYPRHRMRLTELVTPLKPLEAMAQGRIVLASDVGGHLEMVRHRENGYLFAAGDADALARAIVDVLDRREEWPQIARTARAYVETERNWKVSVARYEPIYRRLAAGAGRVGLAESRQA